MGIKGIYGEIGAGERKALYKLAIEKYEETGRPLRIAIDVAIWQFQIQAGRGGSDPAIRTLYYRLLRLLSLCIQPLFVFDGPNKPPFKRNKRTGSGGGLVSNMLTKQLIKYFNFPYHEAPGEAEAECALLQQNGIVDAVMSEDVDTLMFGSNLCLRNWSSEGQRGNKAPTHVSIYSKKAILEKYGLDREGMILVALMSGGDYDTEGIPGCGIKLACEAAKAGFGKSLCAISQKDNSGYKSWRETLAREIVTNNGKFFKTKRKTLQIPENFPDREILGYYTHPVVSCMPKILKLKEEIQWSGEVDVQGLRRFVAEAFDWTHKSGALKFIRGLAPALLAHKLRLNGEIEDSEYHDVILTAMNENELVRAIVGRRENFSTDGIPELRLVYHPIDIVRLDLDAEEESSKNFDRDGLAPRNAEDQIEEFISNDNKSENKTNLNISLYDPTQPDKVWVARTIARIGVPLKVEDYEESLRNPEKFLKAKAAAKKSMTKKNKTSKNESGHQSLPKLTGVCQSLPQARLGKSALLGNSSSHGYKIANTDNGLQNSSAQLKSTRMLSKKSTTLGAEKTTSLGSKGTAMNLKLRTQTGKKASSKTTSPRPALMNNNELSFNKITKLCTQKKGEKNKVNDYLQVSKTFIDLDKCHSPFKNYSHSNASASSRTTNDQANEMSVSFCEPHDLPESLNLGSSTRERISRPPSPGLPQLSDLLKHRRCVSKSEINNYLGPLLSAISLDSPIKRAKSPTVITEANSKDDSQTPKVSFYTKDCMKPEIKREEKGPQKKSAQSPAGSEKFIMLSDTLPGTWKLVDGSDNILTTRGKSQSSNYSQERTQRNLKSTAHWRMSQIECLDLSAD